MDKIYEQTMLFDFYGELLTEHQRSVYEDAVYHDLSLGEIAEERGISRQGVHDLLKRCDRILQEYESKLHLVERFAKAKRALEEIDRLTSVAVESDHKGEGTAADTIYCMEADLKSKAEEAGSAGSNMDGKKARADRVTDEGMGMKERLQAIRRISRELLEEL